MGAMTGMSTHKTGKAASVNAGPSGEVRIINNTRSRFRQLVPRLIRLHPIVVLSFGLMLYFTVLLLFAVIYYAIGSDCFKIVDGGEFSFLEMTWLSVHTISTIGYGSIHPVCAVSQFVVSLESYVSVLVQAVVSAYVVFILMRSRAHIRFSKNCLVSRVGFSVDAGEDILELNFRLVRESHTAVRDACIYVQARFWLPVELDDASPLARHTDPTRPGSRQATGCMAESGAERHKAKDVRCEVEVTPHQMSSLDHWHVAHRVTASSPLWPIRHNLKQHLRSVDVSLSAHDTAFHQDVRRQAGTACASPVQRTARHNCAWGVAPGWHATPAHARRPLSARCKCPPAHLTLFSWQFECLQLTAHWLYARALVLGFWQVKLYVHYKREEILHGRYFEPMDATSEDGSVTTIDHAKLDTLEDSALQRSILVRMPSLASLSGILPSILALSQSGSGDSSIKQGATGHRSSHRSSQARPSSADPEAGLGLGPEREVASPCTTMNTCTFTTKKPTLGRAAV